MTILPNKRQTGNNKDSESDNNNSSSNHNQNRHSQHSSLGHSRGLLSPNQILIQNLRSEHNENNQSRLNSNAAHSMQQAHALLQNDNSVGSSKSTQGSSSKRRLLQARSSHNKRLQRDLNQSDAGTSQNTATVRKNNRNHIRERVTKRKGREHVLDHVPTSSGTQSPLTRSQPESEVGEEEEEEGEEGCNSEDEYDPWRGQQISEEEWVMRDKDFSELMGKRGLVVKNMVEDGACLFRAIADQVYGDQDMHSVVRSHCMDYIFKNRDFFGEYITEDINRYVTRKRNDFVHGNHLEIQALSEMYNRTIEVYCYQSNPINIFHSTGQKDYEPIRLSYQRGSHYNSIRDPYSATVGVGLGLPNHRPGEADRNLVNEAVKASELQLIEQTMMEDKLAASDWEATNEAIQEQVARESFATFVKERSERYKDPQAGCSSATTSSTVASRSPRSGHASPQHPSSHSRLNRLPTPPHRIPTPPVASLRQLPSGHRVSTPPHRIPTPPHRIQTPPASSTQPENSEYESKAPNNSLQIVFEEVDENNCAVFRDAKHKKLSGPVYDQFRGWGKNSEMYKSDNVISNLPPEVFGLANWGDDADVIARVLAESQQEYLDGLKAARSHHSSENSDQIPGPSSFSNQ